MITIYFKIENKTMQHRNCFVKMDSIVSACRFHKIERILVIVFSIRSVRQQIVTNENIVHFNSRPKFVTLE